jgi:hypothetical protein
MNLFFDFAQNTNRMIQNFIQGTYHNTGVQTHNSFEASQSWQWNSLRGRTRPTLLSTHFAHSVWIAHKSVEVTAWFHKGPDVGYIYVCIYIYIYIHAYSLSSPVPINTLIVNTVLYMPHILTEIDYTSHDTQQYYLHTLRWRLTNLWRMNPFCVQSKNS